MFHYGWGCWFSYSVVASEESSIIIIIVIIIFVIVFPIPPPCWGGFQWGLISESDHVGVVDGFVVPSLGCSNMGESQ